MSARDWQIAARFAPVIYQETAPLRAVPLAPPSPFNEEGISQADFITRVDFDGNWIAFDNWQNFESPDADFRAVVYFSSVETESHFFLSYTVFHPRDVGSIHENDLEGAMVAVQKGVGKERDRVAYVQTLAHGVFYKYRPPDAEGNSGALPLGSDRLLMEGERPILYVEPRGHGMKRYDGKEPLPGLRPKTFIVYRYKGRAEVPAPGSLANVGYDLVPIYSTVWIAARLDAASNATFTDFRDYGEFDIRVARGAVAEGRVDRGDGSFSVSRKLERVGSSLIGNDGRPNAAHPPWGWSLDGKWFFLPAEEFKKDFRLGEEFSLTYVHHPFLRVFRSRPRR